MESIISIKKHLLVFMAVMCFTAQFFSQTFTNVTWAELTAEHGETINSNDIIVVEPTDRLILTPNCSSEINLNAKGILVYGELVFDDSDPEVSNCDLLTLTTDWILVAQNAAFIAGTEEAPLSNNFQLVLSGSETDEFDLRDVRNRTQNYISTGIATGTARETGMPSALQLENMVGDDNYSFLMAMGFNARIIMHSSDAINKKTWVQLQGTVQPGNRQLYFNQQTGWEVGDKIVIASTDFDLNQAEEFTITRVENNSRRVYLDNPLAYMHYGAIETYSNNTRSWDLDMRAEVGLLSRNIRVRGDVNYQTSRALNRQDDQFGGHIMAMMGGDLYISGIEFQHMGQAGKLGRYPAHWHMLVDVNGQYIKNSSFHHTFNKGMTIHGTSNALIRENLVYENIGHSYFIEDGSETGNQFINNLAINTRTPLREADESPNSDDFNDASGFWIENSENTFTGNHSAGSERNGFFFSLRGLNGLSRGREYLNVYTESREGPKDFTGNTAHSAADRAFFLNHAGYVRDESYRGTDAAPQVVDEFWEVHDFTAYKSHRGTYVRGIGGDFYEVKMGDIEEGTRYRLNQSLNNSLVVARTGNIGTPTTTQEISQGRSLPESGGHTGHQLYDGPAGINNVHFAGFTGSDDYAIEESNAVQKSLYHYLNNITFGPEVRDRNKLSFSLTTIESKGLVDIDGSLTGTPGTTLIGELTGNKQLYASEGSDFDSDWNTFINYPEFTFGIMTLRGDFYENEAFSNSDINGTVDRNDGNVTSISNIIRSDGMESGALTINNNREQSVFVANGAYDYTMTLVNMPSNFQFYMSDLPVGDSVIYEVIGLDLDLSYFTLDDQNDTRVPQVSSIAALESANTTSYYRNRSLGTFYIKFVSQMRHSFAFPQPKMTFGNKAIGGVKVNVTLLNEALSTTDNELDSNTITLYPNPTINTFKIKLSDYQPSENDTIEVVSTLGQIIREFDVDLNKNYNVSDLKHGIYFVVFKKDGQPLWSRKLLKRN